MPIVNEDFTQDPIQEIKDPLKEEESVSEKDIFRLAKSILFACLGLYALVLILFAWGKYFQIETGPMKEIWDFSSQGLFGIINLIIGFYFGGKIVTARKN